jgi:spermidine/putrescine transport system substrate-binding protein
MKKRWLLFVLLTLLLTACGGNDNVVNVYNWGEYIDTEVLRQFEDETGITVVYDTFVTNEDMYVKMKNDSSQFDVVIPSDYMIDRMIKEDMVQPLDASKIPNREKVNTEFFSDMTFDADGTYSVPYMWGTLGIVYDKTKVSPAPTSWDVLWDPQYEGRIVMMDSVRDTLGIALVRLGYSMNARDEAQLEEAKNTLIEQKPLVYAYRLDETKDMMVQSESDLAVMYSGDAYVALSGNENLEYVVPEEGSNLWIDGMVITKDAKNVDNAHAFINFMTRFSNKSSLIKQIVYKN